MTTHTIVRGRGLLLAALAALVLIPVALVAAPTPAAGQEQEAATEEVPSGEPTAAPASVVSSKRVVAKRRKVVRKRFRPWAKPSPRQVLRIIRIESRRWGIDPAGLSRRVACESHYEWSANGGAYYGLLQFAPSTFYRGVGSLRTRRVAFKRVGYRKVRGRTVTRYSDGRVVRERHRPKRQRVVTIVHGRLPRNPDILHAWTQIRIGAQAIRGISAVSSSDWGCPA